jgi:calpain-15
MFESGKLIEVIVDNLFPNVYVRPVGNDISPMLLEKAYAQVYGSFEVVSLGYAIDAMRDLTGAPIEELALKDKARLRTRVKECFQNKYGMVIASKVEGVTPCLSAKHSYNVLNYEIVGGELFL